MINDLISKFIEFKPKLNLLKPHNLYKICENSFKEMKFKLQDLIKTNFDLAVYHLHVGNINDAIFRFKVVLKYSKKVNSEVYFLLGRCYQAKRKKILAKEYFEKYLASNHSKFIEEAKYCLQIIENKVEKIDKLPEYIINLKNNQLHSSVTASGYYQDLKLNERLSDFLEDQHHFFNVHVIDIGCSVSQCLKEFSLTQDCKYILGIANNKIMGIDRFLKDKLIYNKIIKKDFSNFSFGGLNSNLKFNIIFVLEIFNFRKNLHEILENLVSHLDECGVMIASLNVSKFADDYFLDATTEEFVYNEDYIANILSASKCEIWDSLQRTNKKSNIVEKFIFIKKKLT